MLFLDESKTPPKRPGAQEYFVLGGVIVPDCIWHTIRDELNGIKQKYGVTGEIKWRYFSPSSSDVGNSLVHLDADKSNELRRDIFRLITDHKEIRLICVVTSVKAAYQLPSIKTADDIYDCTYKPATEQFQYYLQDIEKETGERECGIIICDHRNSGNDAHLMKLHQELLTVKDEHRSEYSHLIEGLFIAPSHWSIGIQLADMVAGAVFREFERNDKSYVRLIKSSFRCSPTGEILGWGLVKHPKGGWT